MKTTIKEHKQEKPFPKLMVSDTGVIVLFSDEINGVVIYDDTASFVIGEHNTNFWDMYEFKDFHGTITLEND